MVVETDWKPGNPIFAGRINGEPISLQIEKDKSFYKIRHSGLAIDVRVMSPLAAELRSRMPPKVGLDYSNQLVSPMPGLLLSINVKEGQKVNQGETVAVVEAMKMENRILVEKDAVVSKIYLKSGENVEVGQLIMELE